VPERCTASEGEDLRRIDYPEPELSELLRYCRAGIIFSAPMVLAILEGRKTVTRRLDTRWLNYAGEMLYVRETFEVLGTSRDKSLILYEADREQAWREGHMASAERGLGRRYPSIHMPRTFSRAVLKVGKPRLERLQDIHESDARREGVAPAACEELCDCAEWSEKRYRRGFEKIWKTLHTKPGERWEDNPEVVRLPFTRIA
jgi:hypothetical protein